MQVFLTVNKSYDSSREGRVKSMTGDLGGQSVWPYRKTGKELKSVAMDRVEGHFDRCDHSRTYSRMRKLRALLTSHKCPSNEANTVTPSNRSVYSARRIASVQYKPTSRLNSVRRIRVESFSVFLGYSSNYSSLRDIPRLRPPIVQGASQMATSRQVSDL